MKGIKSFLALIIIFNAFVLVLSGCGSSDNGTSTSSTITGMASKGPIKGGTAEVFAINADGTTGALLGTATTGSDGSYSVNIGTYTGDVLVEVSGGTYTDEVTGDPNISNTILRAAVTGVTGTVSVAVTPLTEIAVQYAKDPNTGALTKDDIDTANSLVSTMTGVNIINTFPVDITSESGSLTATVDQVNYGLMLATISQMVADDPNTNIGEIITNIKEDLSDNQLDETGGVLADALDSFLANENNNSGVTDLDQTNLDYAIDFITHNPLTPTENVSDLIKAKALVTDLRNTALSIYNYQGIGIPGIVETPFKNLSEELTTEIEPELTATVDRIAWIIGSISSGEMGDANSVSITSEEDPNITLEIAWDDDEGTGGFTVTEGETLTDSGTVTINDLNLNDLSLPVSGSFQATMKTASGNLTANLTFSAQVSSGVFTGMTFTGSLTAPGFSIDFSQSGRKLTATLAQIPDYTPSEDADFLDDIYPTSIYLAGRITTGTARMDGVLNISSTVWVECEEEGGGNPFPKAATFQGSFEELQDGAGTGVKFTGTITGAWDNSTTYDDCLDTSTTNFIQWHASFDGRIEAPSRPTITAFLKVTQSEYRKAALEVNYYRTNPDSTVVFLSGTGTYDDTGEDEITTVELTNQNGLILSLTIDESESEGEELSGTIKTSGNEKMADIDLTNDMPMVKYIDGYIESVI